MFGEIITREATKRGIDPRIIAAVIAIESAGDPKARRYESAFYDQYILGRTRDRLGGFFPTNRSLSTELHDRAYSWGLMQMMGQLARELGYNGDMVDLLDPETNITLGCQRFADLFFKSNCDMDKTLDRWNGGADPKYKTKVRAAIGGEVARNILLNACDSRPMLTAFPPRK